MTKAEASAALREPALRCADAVLETEHDVIPTLVHGDFGPHNLLLHEGSSAPSIIDTDNAAWADSATDIAPLLSYYPAEDLSPDFPPVILQRAVPIKTSLALQTAAAGEIARDTELRDHALRNFARKIPTANRTHQGRPLGR
jgi:aminoglycoside phosphotransferase (APT) family kinase protein